MITACHNCKINGLVEAFASFIENLPTKRPAKLTASVEYTRWYLLAKCKNCKRASQDDIRIKKSPHAKSEYMIVTQATQGGRVERKSLSPVTALDEANETCLRMGMATLFGLSPIQFLLVQHLMTGGRLAKFGEKLRAIHEQISKYRGSERAQAGMMRDAILARAPMLAPVLAPCYAGAGMSSAFMGGLMPGNRTAPEEYAASTSRPHAGAASHAVEDKAAQVTEDGATPGQAVEEDDLALPSGDLWEFFGVNVPFDKLERKTRR